MRLLLALTALSLVACGGTATGTDPVGAEQRASEGPKLVEVAPDAGAPDSSTPLADAGPTPSTEAGQDSGPSCEYTSAPPARTNTTCASDMANNVCPCGAGYKYECDGTNLASPENVQGCSILTLGAETVVCCTQLAGTRFAASDMSCPPDFPRAFYYPAGTQGPITCQQTHGYTCCK